MRKCAAPSPARQRENSSTQNLDNNISDTNALTNGHDELLVTNESSAAHQFYTDMEDSIKNKSKLINSNLLERNNSKKNATITKDSYSPLKSTHYYIDSRYKRVSSSSPKSGKLLALTTERNKSFEESELLDPPIYGQKLSTTESKSTMTTERIKAIQNARQQHFTTRNLVASHRRGMMNFKSSASLINPSVASRGNFPDGSYVEDSHTEESHPAAAVVINSTTPEFTSPNPKRNHGILLELPPSTIQLDMVEDRQVTELKEEPVTNQIPSDRTEELFDAHDKSVTDGSVQNSSSVPITIGDVELEGELVPTSPVTEPSIVDKVLNTTEPYHHPIPNINLLFPNISTVASLLPQNDTETLVRSPAEILEATQITTLEVTSPTTELPVTSSTQSTTSTTASTTSTTSTSTTTTTTPSTTTSTTTVPTTTTTSTTPSTTTKTTTTTKIVATIRPPFPKPVYSSPTFRPKIRPIFTSTTTTTTSTTTAAPTTSTSSTTMPSINFNSNNESTLFPATFNLSSIFSKYPVPKASPASAEFAANSTIVMPTRTIVELDSVLLRHNTDVTIELQRMNMATYVLAGLGMFPIVIIILYVIKTIIYNKHQLKANTAVIPSSPEQYDNQKISPVVKIDGKGQEEFEVLKEMEFNRNNLRFKSILGEGNFGQVWKAEADDLTGHLGTTRIVAVKTERAENGASGGLKTEAEIMYKLGSHPNVVTLLGTCIEQEPDLLIMEFAMRGRLLSLLRAARSAIHSMGVSVGTVRNSSIPLSPRRLSGFAHDIARGMEYIASKNVRHLLTELWC